MTQVKEIDLNLRRVAQFFQILLQLLTHLAFVLADNVKIFLAGLDGYNKNSPKKFEMDDVLQNYKSEKKARKIVSLTPTNYKIKTIRI